MSLLLNYALGVCSILIGLVLAAAILRAACRLCGVKEPGLFKAVGIALLVTLVQTLVSLPIAMVLAAVGTAHGMPPRDLRILASLAGLPEAILVAAILYVPLLKVSFGKGMLVALVQVLVILVLGALVAVLYVLLFPILLSYPASGGALALR